MAAQAQERGRHAKVGLHYKHINQPDQPTLVIVDDRIIRSSLEDNILYLVAQVKAELQAQYPEKKFGLAPYKSEEIQGPAREVTKYRITSYLIYEQ